MNTPETVKIRTFAGTLLLVSIIFLVALNYAFSIPYVEDVTEPWITLPLQEASYVIGQYNSSHYYARNWTGYGTSANKGYEFLESNKTQVIQNCMDSCESVGGTIFLYEVEMNTSITIPSNTVVIEHYQGKIQYYFDNGWQRDTIRGTAGEAVDEGEIVYFKSDGKYWLADADSSSLMCAVAVALENVAINTEGQFMIEGYYKNASFSWTVGSAAPIYVSTTAGALTQTVPSGTGDQVQVVGYAIASDTVYFDFDSTVVEVG